MGRLYLFLCLCLGMVGCMAGSLSQIGSGSAGAARSAGQPEFAGGTRVTPGADGGGDSRGSRMSSYAGPGLVLDRRSDGHFYANVEINGSTIEMLVDTGASGVALSENDARRAGIATSIGMRDHVGEGAGGAVYGEIVRLERVRLGEVEVDDVPAVVLKGGNMSLLGQSFLGRFGKVEIAGDRMILNI